MIVDPQFSEIERLAEPMQRTDARPDQIELAVTHRAYWAEFWIRELRYDWNGRDAAVPFRRDVFYVAQTTS